MNRFVSTQGTLLHPPSSLAMFDITQLLSPEYIMSSTLTQFRVGVCDAHSHLFPGVRRTTEGEGDTTVSLGKRREKKNLKGEERENAGS